MKDGEAPLERGIYLRLQGMDLTVEVYERLGKSVIWVCETDEFYGFVNLRKSSFFVIDSFLKDSTFTAVKRDATF